MPTQSSGLIAWLSQYGQMILFFAQLLFWLAVAIAALWSTLLFKRLVEAKTDKVGVAEAPTDAEAKPADEKPNVDDFVD
jgi:hypothetical protein